MAVTDSSVRASTGGRGLSAILVAVVLVIVAARTSAARIVGGVSGDGRSRREAAGAGRGRRSSGGRGGRADRATVVDGGNGTSLGGRGVGSVDQLLLPVYDNRLAGLERRVVGEHGTGADGEVDVYENDVGVERLTWLLAALAVATLLLFLIRLLIAGGRSGAFGLCGGRGVCRRLAGEVLDLVSRCGAGGHDEDVVALIAVFNGGGGHDERVLALAENEADVDELVGEERAILIVEDCLELGSAGGGVDLVVDGE